MPAPKATELNQMDHVPTSMSVPKADKCADTALIVTTHWGPMTVPVQMVTVAIRTMVFVPQHNEGVQLIASAAPMKSVFNLANAFVPRRSSLTLPMEINAKVRKNTT